MSTYDIPKKSRNKYGYVKNVTGNNYITTQQMMATSGAGGGAGGGTVINNQWAVAIGYQVNEKTNQAKEDSYTYICYTLSQSSYVSLPELQAMSYITQSDLSSNSYATQSYVTNECSDIKTECYNYTDSKSSQDAETSKNSSYTYTDSKVSDLKTEIENELAKYAWPFNLVTADYTVEEMEVGTMRPVFINNSSTINLTMPGDSTEQYIILAMNVITSVLVSAGKNPRYIAAVGGSSTAISWTSNSEPYMLCLILRIS